MLDPETWWTLATLVAAAALAGAAVRFPPQVPALAEEGGLGRPALPPRPRPRPRPRPQTPAPATPSQDGEGSDWDVVSASSE